MIRFITALVLTVFLGGSHAMDAALSDIETIKNVNMVEGTISRHEVRLIFTLKTRYWHDGTKIVVVHFPLDSAGHRAFVRHVLDMRLSTYTRMLEQQQNSGYHTSVMTAKTPDDMLNVVQNKTGAIGYLSKDYLVVNGLGHIDVLKIID